ncbi:MAG TPA: PAAR domain-containing protein [Pseudoduganella sp.]
MRHASDYGAGEVRACHCGYYVHYLGAKKSMADSIVVIGDGHTHGGFVLAGSPSHKINGRPIARMGDAVSCPLHGISRISQVRGLYKVDGVPGAASGDMTECGAVLIGSVSARVGS